MTTERRITLSIVTDETGTKCVAECPHHDYLWTCEMPDDDELPAGWRCRVYDEQGESEAKMNVRHDACIAAESAAREAEVDALKRGSSVALDAIDADGHGDHGGVDRRPAWAALNAEIERIRGGES